MEFSIGLSCHDTITSPSTSSRELNVKKNSIAFNENYPHMRLYITCMHVKIRKRLHKLDKSVNCRFSRKKNNKINSLPVAFLWHDIMSSLICMHTTSQQPFHCKW